MKRSNRRISRLISILLGVYMMFSLFGCGKISQKPDGDGMEYKPAYTQISQDEAKLMMQDDDDNEETLGNGDATIELMVERETVFYEGR